MDITRRDAIKLAGLGAAGVLLNAAGCRADQAGTLSGGSAVFGGEMAGSHRYMLPPLPYKIDALEPVIDARTLGIHHDKHHAGYVKGANAVLDKLDDARAKGDYAAIKALSRDLAFAASGVVLHNLYWLSMSPGKQEGPGGRFAEQLDSDFGGLGAFRAQFAAAAKAVEGSGWAVLVWEPTLRQLLVLQIEKHQDLTVWGAVPLLTCDVWEHAYYVKYQNARSDYVDGWMTIIDWAAAGKRFDAAVGTS